MSSRWLEVGRHKYYVAGIWCAGIDILLQLLDCYAVGYVAVVELRVVTESHSVTDAAYAMWLVCCRNLEKKFGSTTDKEQRV